MIYEEIGRRRQASDLEQRTDILSLLMQARDEEGEAMTDGELRDELVTLLLAGHETTATSVAWAIERLVRHPDKLRAADRRDGRRRGRRRGVHDGGRQRDAARAAGGADRGAAADRGAEVGGYRLPAGTRVVPSIYLTNRNPRVYERPREFRPERFLGEAPETFSWIPFGGGIRRCIGASFAQMEMKLILRTMLSASSSRTLPSGWRGGGAAS